jgi:hypothetical protein
MAQMAYRYVPDLMMAMNTVTEVRDTLIDQDWQRSALPS